VTVNHTLLNYFRWITWKFR